jgi:ATP-dependent Clp protease ATP-binding subunit ClpC
MFERYPASSVRALFVARDTALSLGALFIEVEHLLVGAVEVWPGAGLRRSEVLGRLGLMVPTTPPRTVNPDMQFSALVQRVLSNAMSQADRLRHHRIHPEHLLLALLEAPDCPASAILHDVGFERDLLVESAAREALVDDGPLAYTAHLESKVTRGL